MKQPIQRFSTCRNGTTSLEFAIIGPAFLLLLLGTLITGMLFWSKAAVQFAASQTARCRALGSPDCSDPAAYVSSIMSKWGVAGFVKSVSVSVQADTACNRTAGHFYSVTITGTGYTGGGLLSPLANVPFSASACYPSKA